jgi:2-keto-4-pentenoate hydratase/2-oxohepta-3-ene-1,7-dioic acid hydratase in catechol pathway
VLAHARLYNPKKTASKEQVKEEIMKLVRFGEKGQEKPGLVDESGEIRSLEGHVDDITGATLSEASLQQLQAIDIETLPVLFTKATSALNGPDDDVILPRGSEKTDWECELAFVIGKEAKYVSEDDAMDYVAGYTIMNDVSERAYQLESTGQWVKGKSCDTFAPLGPWLVTKDEIADPQNLSMWLEVNGTRFQEGTTETMIFGVKHLVSYLSRFMSLQPGDVVSTGTPPGVGMGQKPSVYLKDGDKVMLGIQGLGVQEQSIKS